MEGDPFIILLKMAGLIAIPFVFRYILFGFAYMFIKGILWILQTCFGFEYALTNQIDIQIPLLVYRKSDSTGCSIYKFSQESCAICLDDFKEGEDLQQISECGHIFHLNCLTKWIQAHKNCPYCRLKLIKSDQGEEKPTAPEQQT
jgi:RING-finger-containing ubiquitin ligase